MMRWYWCQEHFTFLIVIQLRRLCCYPLDLSLAYFLLPAQGAPLARVQLRVHALRMPQNNPSALAGVLRVYKGNGPNVVTAAAGAVPITASLFCIPAPPTPWPTGWR